MAANATDERLYFSSKIEDSILLSVDQTARQTSDAMGPLQPGKYLVQLVDMVDTSRCFIKMVPWVAAAAASVVVTAAPSAGASALIKELLIDEDGPLRSFTFHVRAGINDRLQAIMTSGHTALLVITRIGE